MDMDAIKKHHEMMKERNKNQQKKAKLDRKESNLISIMKSTGMLLDKTTTVIDPIEAALIAERRQEYYLGLIINHIEKLNQ